MGVDFSTAARRIRGLCSAGLLERRSYPLSTMSALIPTRDGCEVAADELTPIGGIRVATSRHDTTLVDCACSLERRFTGRFEPERRLRQRVFSAADHWPDGLLHRPDEPPIAIELELSQKSPRRLTGILDAYAATLSIKAVWYIVMDDAVESHVRRFAEGRPYIMIKRWTNTLYRPRLLLEKINGTAK
jgi:hypothetical protein